MKKLALVVDSSTNIKNNEFEDVYVVPMILTKEVNGVVKTFRDEIDINSKQMLQDMMSGSVYKTASPLLGECSTLLDKLSSSYENVFVLSLHRKVSSTYSQWILLSNEYENVKVFDFPIGGAGCRENVKDILSLLNSNQPLDKIIEYIEEMPKKNLLSVILNETKYLVRGGRLSLTKGIAASMLRLKLVIYFDHTGLVLEGKTFKTSSCIEMAKNIFKEKIGANDENVESVTIFTSGIDNMKSNIEVMKNAFSVMFKKAKIFYENLTSVFVAHTGPSYCGVSVKIK